MIEWGGHSPLLFPSEHTLESVASCRLVHRFLLLGVYPSCQSFCRRFLELFRNGPFGHFPIFHRQSRIRMIQESSDISGQGCQHEIHSHLRKTRSPKPGVGHVLLQDPESSFRLVARSGFSHRPEIVQPFLYQKASMRE